MKTNLTKKFFVATSFAMMTCVMSAQIDLVPGMSSTYNAPGSDNIITGISADACNNDNGAASSFDLSVYLYDQGTSNYWVIGTVNFASLSGNACQTYSGWDIDIDDTPGIPAGNYRVGLWIDSNSDITETDENNNAGLLSGTIYYNGVSGINTNEIPYLNLLQTFPNPADESSAISFTTGKSLQVSVEIYDLMGKKVAEIPQTEYSTGQHTVNLDCSGLQPGVYFISLSAGSNSISRKLSVIH
jgi:hypothetical protein